MFTQKDHSYLKILQKPTEFFNLSSFGLYLIKF